MKKIKTLTGIFCFLGWLFPQIIQAQSKSNLSIGLSIGGGIGAAIHSGENYKTYSDTTKSSFAFVFNKAACAWLTYSLGKHSDIQFGIGYQQTGFGRKQKGLIFKDYTYPGIGTGTVLDRSNTRKGINYDYRFHYLQFPVLFNTYLFRSSDFKWFFHYSAGLNPQLLLKHQLVANTIPGYSIEGEDHFTMDSTGFIPRTFALGVQLGMLIEFRETRSHAYFLQPLVGIHPFSVSSGENQAIPYFFQINVGMLFSGKE